MNQESASTRKGHKNKLSFMVFMFIIFSTAIKTKQNRMFLSTRKMHPHVQKHSKYKKMANEGY